MPRSLGCNVIQTILKAERVEMFDMLVFYKKLTQLIARNMSTFYRRHSFKYSVSRYGNCANTKLQI